MICKETGMCKNAAACFVNGGCIETGEKWDSASPATAIKVAGLGRITNEDNGYLTLQFEDEDAACQFVRDYVPSVEVDEMPPLTDSVPEGALPPKMTWIDAPDGIPDAQAEAWAIGWNTCRAAVEADRARQLDMSVRLAGAPAGQHDANLKVLTKAHIWQIARQTIPNIVIGQIETFARAIETEVARIYRAQRTAIDNENCRAAPVPDTGIPAAGEDERAQFDAWFAVNKFGGMRESMWAAWEARARRAPVSSTPTPGAVGKAADMLLAAAQGVVNDALEEAEDRVHICDRNDDDRKARAMPPMLQALYHAVKAVQRAAPSRPSEAKAGECRHCLGRGHCFQCFGAKAGEDA